MVLGWLALIDGAVALALALGGVVLAGSGVLTPMGGFQLFAVGFLLSIGAVIFGLVVWYLGRRSRNRDTQNRALAGTLLGAMVAVPVLWIIASTSHYPPINDITTDFDNPPEFRVAPTLAPNRGRDLTYNRAKYADAQRGGYGALAPLAADSAPQTVFELVKITATEMDDWEITRVDSTALSLEAVSTSRLFRFQDDVIVEVRPAPDGATHVHMRSKSRDGVGDLGANHTRIQSFFEKLKARLSGHAGHDAPPESS
jgi:uncharacterized protein (DUF1499 family)